MSDMQINRIIQKDCLEGLKELPDECVDLIITSPPYNLGKDHHTGSKRTNTYVDNIPEGEYQEWQIDVLNECYRTLRATGSMLYNHKNRIKKGRQITPYEWMLRTNFYEKQEIVWFNRSQNFDKIRFYPMTERVYWLTKSTKTKLYNAINHHDVFDAKDWPPVGTSKQFKRAFPEKMVTDILACFPEAQTVLDPFMGSGTVAVACIKQKRDYIGFELNPEYVKIAEERIKKETAQATLF